MYKNLFPFIFFYLPCNNRFLVGYSATIATFFVFLGQIWGFATISTYAFFPSLV
jgi:hypothetical protein